MSYDETQDQQPAEHHEITGEPSPDDGGLEFDPAYVAGSGKPVNRQAVVLGGLLVVGAAAIWFVYFHKGPAPAAAAPDERYNEVANFDAGKINLMKQTLKDTEKVVQQFRNYPGRTQIPLADLRTNPFRELEPKSDDTPKPVVKSDEEELHHKRVTLAVADLRLQSIIKGRRPACMINNVFYRQGDRIGDLLTIEEITSHAVIVRGEKWRYELKIQN